MRKVLFLTLMFTSSTLFVPKLDEPITIELDEVEVKLDESKDFNEYLNDIGFRESSNRYHVTNRLGYMGRYQFGMSTLKTIGIKTTREQFLSDPRIQEKAMLRNLKRNKRVLKTYIDQYNGTLFGDSVYITESGILAAAHIAGATGVKRFFDDGIDRKDSFGTKFTDYLTEFSGYNMSKIE